MKRLWGWFLFIGALMVIGYLVWDKYEQKTIEANRTADHDRIQREYYERVGWIRANPDERAYRDEVGMFLRWYFKEINEHHNRFGGNRNFDGYLQEIEKRSERLSEAAIEERRRIYEQVKAQFDQFRTGTYSPMFSATDDGMRLDIVNAEVKSVNGERKVRMPIVLWGAQREMREDSNRVKRMLTSASFAFNWKLFDEKGKLHGEMSAQGDPVNKNDWPERFIPEFPPQIILGELEIDTLPAEVARLEAEITVTSRSPTGGEAKGTYVWKIDVPSEWKLKPGETWKDATVEERPLEEIDPAAAARLNR